MKINKRIVVVVVVVVLAVVTGSIMIGYYGARSAQRSCPTCPPPRTCPTCPPPRNCPTCPPQQYIVQDLTGEWRHQRTNRRMIISAGYMTGEGLENNYRILEGPLSSGPTSAISTVGNHLAIYEQDDATTAVGTAYLNQDRSQLTLESVVGLDPSALQGVWLRQS